MDEDKGFENICRALGSELIWPFLIRQLYLLVILKYTYNKIIEMKLKRRYNGSVKNMRFPSDNSVTGGVC